MEGATQARRRVQARGGAAQDLALQLIPAFRGLWGRADLDLHRAHRALACGIRELLARVVEGPDDAGNIGQGERVLRKNVKHVRS